MSMPIDIRIISNLSGPDWWTIALTGASTVIAASMGAGVAYWVGRQTSNDNKAAALSSRREAEEAATLRLMVKLIQLLNSIAGCHLGLERGIATAKQELGNDEAPLWVLMRSQVGRTDDVQITADDLIFLTRAKEFKYLSQILILNSHYNSAIDAMAAYSDYRENLMAKITPVEMNGLVGRIQIPLEEFQHLRPYIATADHLARQLRKQFLELYDTSRSVVRDFGPKARDYFKDPSFPIVGFVAEAEAAQI